jgi:hypothetical protein
MNLTPRRLSLVRRRLVILERTQAQLHGQFLELTDLREQLREAQLSADLRKVTRARKPALIVIATAAQRVPPTAAGYAGEIGAGAS